MIQPFQNQKVLNKLSTVSLALLVILGLNHGTFEFLKFLFGDGNENLLDLFGLLIFAPFIEELMYRVVPIKLALAIGPKAVIPAVILSSYLFGIAHVNPFYPGMAAILIQGVGGLILSWVYIKNNYNYWFNVLLHFLINFTLTFAL